MSILVEGTLDAAVATRLAAEFGYSLDNTFGRKGWTYIRDKACKYYRSIQHPLITLVDFMDTQLDCPAEVVRNWCSQCETNGLFRVVVNEVESWLMADREGMSKFLHVPLAQVPAQPENLPDPKQTLVGLARKSKNKAVREAIVPDPDTGGTEGPLYTAELINFVVNYWNVGRAAGRSASLKRAISRLGEVLTTPATPPVDE